MDAETTREPAETLQNMWQGIVGAGQGMAQPAEHLSEAILYDVALGELAPELREEVHVHLADCDVCIQQLVTFQAAISANRKVHGVWEPRVFHAAGGVPSQSVIQDGTKEGKYVITLQPPTGDGQRELLTLEVTPSFRQDLEGLQVVLVNRHGKEILRDTISGGIITRLIDRQWRDTWPFRVQAP